MLGESSNSLAMVGMAMESETRSIRLTMVSRKIIPKILQRTEVARAVVATAGLTVAGATPAAGRCTGALERSMVRTSFYCFCCGVAVALTIRGEVITV